MLRTHRIALRAAALAVAAVAFDSAAMNSIRAEQSVPAGVANVSPVVEAGNELLIVYRREQGVGDEQPGTVEPRVVETRIAEPRIAEINSPAKPLLSSAQVNSLRSAQAVQPAAVFATPEAAAPLAGSHSPQADAAIRAVFAAEPPAPSAAQTPSKKTSTPASLRLGPRSRGNPTTPTATTASPASSAATKNPRYAALLDYAQSKGASLATAGSGLAIVVGLFMLTMWLMKRRGPQGAGVLPSEAFAVLGRAPLAPHSMAHLLRLGNKLLLISVTADGASLLGEVTDLAEVDRLAGLCAGGKTGSSTAEFQQVLAQLSREPAKGFLGREAAPRGRTR